MKEKCLSGATKQHREMQHRKKCKNQRRSSEYQTEEKQRERPNSNGQQEPATVQDRRDGAAESREIEAMRKQKRQLTAQIEPGRTTVRAKLKHGEDGSSRSTWQTEGTPTAWQQVGP